MVFYGIPFVLCFKVQGFTLWFIKTECVSFLSVESTNTLKVRFAQKLNKKWAELLEMEADE